MSKRFLLAAEVDKIQEYIFRSSKLREIVGGSRLITKFCSEDARILFEKVAGKNKDADILVSDGGSFRLLFDSQEQAIEFGMLLSELYFQTTGGSLTVASPIEYDSKNSFKKANAAAQEALRVAKMSSKGLISGEHFPLVAICSSCGSGLAVNYCSVVQGESEQNYTCQVCLNKRAERDKSKRDFLGRFIDIIETEFKDKNIAIKIDIDIDEKEEQKEDLSYVAYLKADGNGMGKIFGECQTPDQLRKLSENLNAAMLTALAKTTIDIIKIENELNKSPNPIKSPVLPLIMGGDDCFAILPAKFALDAAQHFCRYFTEEMGPRGSSAETEGTETKGTEYTLSASLAICKKNYPYYFAHQTCEKLIADAKRAAYLWQKDVDSKNYSSITFSIIQASYDYGKKEPEKYYPTAQPYAVSLEQENIEKLSESKLPALPVDILLQAREWLASEKFPFTRLQALRQLYNNPPQHYNLQKKWEIQADNILHRSYLRPNEGKLLEKILKLKANIYDTDNYWWLNILLDKQSLTKENADYYYGHFMPDLIDMWDFSHKLGSGG